MPPTGLRASPACSRAAWARALHPAGRSHGPPSPRPGSMRARASRQRAGRAESRSRALLRAGRRAPNRLGEAGGVALERGHEPCGKCNRQRGAPGGAGRSNEPVVVEQERVGGEGKPEGGQPQGVERGLEDLCRRHVERPEHRDRGPLPEDRPVRARPEERREHEDAKTGRERAVEIDAAAVGGSTQADGEQHDIQNRERPEAVGEQSGCTGRTNRRAAGPGLTGSSTSAPASDRRARRSAPGRRRSRRATRQ